MLEKELELGGCGLGGPKVPEFWISPDSSPPTPLARAPPPQPQQHSPFQQKHLGHTDQGGCP